MGWFTGTHSTTTRPDAAAARRVAGARGGGAFLTSHVAIAAGGAHTATPESMQVIAGRVFGIDELVRELGLVPGTCADAALLLGFRRFGPRLLQRLRGTFAIFLWDGESRRGLVGSDLTSLSAVFVARNARGVAFASEMRDLIDILPSRPPTDSSSISRAIAGVQFVPGSTLFSGVQRLPAGTCLLLEPQGADVVEYWQPRYEGVLKLPNDELYGSVRAHVGVAVDRAIGDASAAAVLLSGGLDSSIVACVAAERGVKVRGFSAVFPQHRDVDESAYIESVEAKWGIECTYRAIPPAGGISAAVEYISAWQLPVLGLGYLLERALISEMAQHGAMALLDGQGGDEMFSYSTHLAAHLLRRGRLVRSVQTLRTTPSTSSVTSPRAIFTMWKRFALKPALPLWLLDAYTYRQAPRLRPWLTDSARQLVAASEDELEWRRSSRGPLWWRWLKDLLLVTPTVSGRSDYVRHRRALAALDGGSPLLDYDLARLLLRVPPELAYDGSFDRPVARRAMVGILPDKVRTRTNKSNLFPFYRDVLAGPDLRWIRRILCERDAAIWEFADRRVLGPFLDSVPLNPDSNTMLRLGVLHDAAMLQCWLRQQEDPAALAALQEEIAADDMAGALQRL